MNDDELIAQAHHSVAVRDAARHKTTRLIAVAVIVAGLSMSFLGAVVWYVVNERSNVVAKTQQEVIQLRTELTEARDLIAASLASTSETAVCTSRFAIEMSLKFRIYLASMGNLVVLIASTTPGADREAAVGNGVTALDAALIEYNAVGAAQEAWAAAGKPQPCPIPEG